MPPAYRCTLSRHDIAKAIVIGLGSLVINIMSNAISTAEQKNHSVRMVVIYYLPLVVTALLVWCLVNMEPIPVEMTFPSDVGLQDTDREHILLEIETFDPLVMERLDPQHTERSHLLRTGLFDPQGERSLDQQDAQRVGPLGILDLHEQNTAGRQEKHKATSPGDGVVAESNYLRLLADYFCIGPHYAGNKLDRFRDRTSSATFPRSKTEFTSPYYMTFSTSTTQAEQMFNDSPKAVHTKQSPIGVEATFQPAGVALRRSKKLQRRRSKP